MATELEQLTASFDADIARFEKKMDQLNVKFDKAADDIDHRNKQLVDRMNAGWAALNASGKFLGLDKVKAAITGLTAGAIVGGVADLAKKSIEAASSISDVAKEAGTSTDFLQKMRFAAAQSGSSFENLDQGLINLNKNLGEFTTTGSGRAADAFKKLGIDKLIKKGDVYDAETAFKAIVTNIQNVGSEAQRASLLGKLLGQDLGPGLLQLVEQGAEGLNDLARKAEALGIVLSDQAIAGAREANDKLATLFQVIKAEGVTAIAGLAPSIADLAQNITDALPGLIRWVEKWAAWFGLITLSPAEKLRIEIADLQKDLDSLSQKRADNPWWKQIIGISNRDLDVLIAADKAKLAKAQQDLLHTPVDLGPLSHAYDTPARRPKLSVPETDEEKALRARRQAALAQTGLDEKTAAAVLIASQDQTYVQLAKGSADYYAAQRKQIEDDFTNKVNLAEAWGDKQRAELSKLGTDWKGYGEAIANIAQTVDDRIASADEDRKRRQDAVGPSSFIREAIIQGDRQIQQYKDETAALGLTTGQLAQLTYEQDAYNEATARGITLSDQDIARIQAKAAAIGEAAQQAHEATIKTEDNIQASDGLRNALEDVGTASLNGFGSMKEAAAQALEQVAQLIFKLYIMKPLVEGLLGEQGSTSSLFGGGSVGGGGFLGGILGLFGGGGGGGWGSYAGDFSEFIGGFAKGGVFVPGHGPVNLPRFAGGGISTSAAIFGEAGPEAAVPLADGRSIPVSLKMPQSMRVPALAPALGNGSGLYFDLRGAVVTQDLLDQMNEISKRHATEQSQKAISTYDRNALPGRVATLQRHPRLAH